MRNHRSLVPSLLLGFLVSCSSATKAPDPADVVARPDNRKVAVCEARYTNDGELKGELADLGKVWLDVNDYKDAAHERKKIRIDGRPRSLYLELNVLTRAAPKPLNRTFKVNQVIALLATDGDKSLSQATAELPQGVLAGSTLTLRLLDHSEEKFIEEVIVTCQP